MGVQLHQLWGIHETLQATCNHYWQKKTPGNRKTETVFVVYIGTKQGDMSECSGTPAELPQPEMFVPRMPYLTNDLPVTVALPLRSLLVFYQNPSQFTLTLFSNHGLGAMHSINPMCHRWLPDA